MLAFLLLLSSSAAPTPTGPDAAVRVVLGTVTDPARTPVANVVVIAVDQAAGRVTLMVASDQLGQVRLRLPNRPHLFGVLSARHAVERLVLRGPEAFTLVLRPLPAPAGAAPGDGTEAPVVRAAGAELIQGRVVDESGHGLAGVRVDAARATDWEPRPQGMRARGVVVSSAISGANGAFTLAVLGGDTQIQARAPGLVLVRSALRPPGPGGRGDQPILVMGIDARPQEVVVSDGQVLQVRLEDSIDPEYSPPASVRAFLQFAYGICPATGPLPIRQKERLKKYWYLDVLRQAPPNPASVSTATCVAAANFRGHSLTARAGYGPIPDLEIVNEKPF